MTSTIEHLPPCYFPDLEIDVYFIKTATKAKKTHFSGQKRLDLVDFIAKNVVTKNLFTKLILIFEL